MRKLLLIINGLCLAMLCSALSCSDTPVASNEVMNCEGEHVTDTLKDVEAKVVDTNIAVSQSSKNYTGRYCLTISKEALNSPAESTFSIDDSLLVPVDGVPERYQKVGKRVIISGLKKSCCGVIESLPNVYLLKPFGCKIELTSIREK